jgi:serine/threonine-protein kinase
MAGLTEADALRLLAAAGLLPGNRSELYDPTVPAGSVISSNPRAGIVVPRNTTVDYLVSLGPTPTPTDTPSPTPSDTPSPTPSDTPSLTPSP